MSLGLMQQLQGEITDDSLPRFYPNDSMLNKGSVFMFDMKNPVTYPAQATPIATGTILHNLVDGAPTAVFNGAATSTFTAGKGIKFSTSGGKIDLGNNYNVVALGNINFVVGIWVKLPAGGEENTSNYQKIIGKYSAPSAGNMQAGIDSGLAGKRPRAQVANAVAVGVKGVSADITLDVVHLLALVFENDLLYFYLDGVSTGAPVALSDPLAAPAVNWIIGTWTNGTIYRWYMENLTASGLSGASQVAAEYAKNSTRYS